MRHGIAKKERRQRRSFHGYYIIMLVSYNARCLIVGGFGPRGMREVKRSPNNQSKDCVWSKGDQPMVAAVFFSCRITTNSAWTASSTFHRSLQLKGRKKKHMVIKEMRSPSRAMRKKEKKTNYSESRQSKMLWAY